jgi:hypothetical protein
MTISEEDLGFIQGYVMAFGNPDDLRLLLFLHDDVVFAKALAEAGERTLARANQHSAKADNLKHEAAALEFEDAAQTIGEVLN